MEEAVREALAPPGDKEQGPAGRMAARLELSGRAGGLHIFPETLPEPLAVGLAWTTPRYRKRTTYD